jgi:A/G-specific adenine glycosylase
MTIPEGFALRLVDWQRRSGRSGLPWQGCSDPYRVWLSEIMLQQTQVSTVLKYYERFLQRFPDVLTLAQAEPDDVFALWAGLGYYSRARNLLKCAQMVVASHGGTFPATVEQLVLLPGIGPSTAAAISAFCQGHRVSIFDGNVQRVLARCAGFQEDLSDSRAQRQLKQLASSLVGDLSEQDMPAYTQGLMDLGATRCTPKAPACGACPFHSDCVARVQGRQLQWPLKTRKISRKTVIWQMHILQRADRSVWLVPRPPAGIWASLYCFPVTEGDDVGPWAGATEQPDHPLEVTRHVLTHRDLVLTPRVWHGGTDEPAPVGWGSAAEGIWVQPGAALEVGVPTPVRLWLDVLGATAVRG